MSSEIPIYQSSAEISHFAAILRGRESFRRISSGLGFVSIEAKQTTRFMYQTLKKLGIPIDDVSVSSIHSGYQMILGIRDTENHSRTVFQGMVAPRFNWFNWQTESNSVGTVRLISIPGELQHEGKGHAIIEAWEDLLQKQGITHFVAENIDPNAKGFWNNMCYVQYNGSHGFKEVL